MPHGSRGQSGTATAEQIFHLEVRRRRCEHGLSRGDLARRTGYSRQYVSQLEQSSRGIPARPVVAAVDAALSADGALLALRDEAVAARAERINRPRDPDLESRRRVNDLLDQRSSDNELEYLDRLVGELIATAEGLAPQDVSARVLDQQSSVDGLLRTPMLPHQQFRLFIIAGHLAGLMAVALLDMGEVAKASTCCLEAAVFTELTGHEGLRAWTLAVNSLVDAAARRGGAAAMAHPAGSPRPARSAGPAGSTSDPRTGTPGTPAPRHQDGPIHPAADLDADAAASAAWSPRAGEPSQATEWTGAADWEVAPGTRPGHPGADAPVERTVGPPSSIAEDAEDDEDDDEPWLAFDDAMILPGGQASAPRLIELVKGRIARFSTASTRRTQPPGGISQAFRPPV